MRYKRSEFKAFLKDEITKTKGRYYPVKAGLLRRLLVRKVACRKMHPNPYDEFCQPGIGPNYEIIADYEEDYRNFKNNVPIFSYHQKSVTVPIVIEKARPDGYVILNGHHRWAAALCAGKRKLNARIVNLTSENDIKRMLDKAASDRRVSLDLDEVVFAQDSDSAERALPFPFRRFYKERLRAGVPALFHFFSRQGYDIWAYTSKYCSPDYIQSYFRHYRVRIAGVVTGMGRKAPAGSDTAGSLEKLIGAKYLCTLHIDRDAVLFTDKETKDFREYPLSGSAGTWTQEIMDVTGEIRQHER